MRTWLCAVLIGIGTIVVGAPVVQAEFCFNAGNTGEVRTNTVVLPKKYSKPLRGTCKPLIGVEALGNPSRLVTGTVCLNAAGNALRVAYLVHLNDDPGGFPHVILAPLHVSIKLPYPSMQNGTSITHEEGSNSFSVTNDATGGSCPSFPLP